MSTRIVITHFHLDHWDDLVPWTSRLDVRPAGASCQPHSSGSRRADGRSSASSASASASQACSTRSSSASTREGEPFEADGLHDHARSRAALSAADLRARASRDGKATLAYSGDSAPSPQLAEVGRDADLFSARRP